MKPRPLLAILLPFIACAVQWVLWEAWIKPYAWFLFFPAAFFSAWLGGLRGGIASTVLGALLAWYVFIPPQFSFALQETAAVASIVLFVGMGGLFAWVFERLTQAMQRTDLALAETRAANDKISELYRQTLELEELKRRELLRSSETRFEATFEQAAVGIALVATDGRWLRVNRKLCAIVGYAPEELMGLNFQDITHPDDLDADHVHVRQMLNGTRHHYTLEKRYLHKDGSIVWVNLSVALVGKPDGSPDYFISVVEDISARKQAQADLIKGEALLSSFFEHAESLVWVKDLAGRFLRVNHTTEQLLGLPRTAILGRSLADLFPAAEADACTDNDRTVIALGRALDFEETVHLVDGTHTFVSTKFPLLGADGTAFALGAICTDITERKRAENELKRRNEELELFDRVAVGRELQMIALKRQINDLAQELGRAPPFDLSFVDAPLPDAASAAP